MTSRLRALGRLLVLASALLAPRAALAAPTEWWLLCARFDSGDALLFEITVTDAGPGDQNAAAVGQWWAPDGSLTPFYKAKREGKWQGSADGRVIDLEKAVFDRSGPRATLTARKKFIRISLDFPLAAQPLASHELAGGKWSQELWASGAPVSATLWREGRSEVRTRGLVSLSHREISGQEAALAKRRLEAFSLGRGAQLYVAELAGAKRSERWVLALDAQGRVIAEALESGVTQGSLGAAPTRLALAAKGATGKLLAGRQLAAYDPLAELPGPVRFLLGLRLRSAWMASPFDVSVQAGGQPLRLQGTALASYTFYAE